MLLRVLFASSALAFSLPAQPPLPELRTEATDGGSLFRIRNTSSQPLTAYLIELVDYPGSSYALWQDETGKEPIPPGGEKRIPVVNMTVGAVPDYVKLQAALFADGSSAGIAEKVEQLIARRRASLETVREAIRRIEIGLKNGKPKADLANELTQWAESIPAPTRANRNSAAAQKNAAVKSHVSSLASRLGEQSVEDVLKALRASERALAASKPAL